MGEDKRYVAGKIGDINTTAADNRLFINATIWIAKEGTSWRALPNEYGKWSSVHKRFRRWAKSRNLAEDL